MIKILYDTDHYCSLLQDRCDMEKCPENRDSHENCCHYRRLEKEKK